MKVTNNGTEEAKNVIVKGRIPDGTVYLTLVDDYVYNYDLYYKENLDVKEFNGIIQSIGSGETKEISYEVRVNKDSVVGNEVTNKIID